MGGSGRDGVFEPFAEEALGKEVVGGRDVVVGLVIE